MANAFSSTSTVSNVVQTAYDQYLEFALRSTPMFRMLADKKPVQQSTAGASVVFELYKDLAAATTPLTETVDPDTVAIGNPDQVTVTVQEYGNATYATKKLEATALTDVDSGIANIVAYNCANSIDILAQTALSAGTNTLVTSGTGGTTLTAGGAASTVDNSSNVSQISSKAIRYLVAQLRSNNVQPRRDDLYGVALHPKVSVDLRAETGAAAWRDPHVYSAPDAIWAGEIGQYEGCFYVENPRVFNSQSGAGTGGTQTRVFNTYVFGKQALAEGVAIEPSIVIGEVTDRLKRFRPLGWYAMIGWAVYRQAALWQLLTSSTLQPNA